MTHGRNSSGARAERPRGHLGGRRELPARGTAKARLLATLEALARQVESLPESACVVLEEARVLDTLRRHMGTMGEVSNAMQPVREAISSITRAVNALSRVSKR